MLGYSRMGSHGCTTTDGMGNGKEVKVARRHRRLGRSCTKRRETRKAIHVRSINRSRTVSHEIGGRELAGSRLRAGIGSIGGSGGSSKSRSRPRGLERSRDVMGHIGSRRMIVGQSRTIGTRRAPRSRWGQESGWHNRGLLGDATKPTGISRDVPLVAARQANVTVVS
jgi:hypothetical protein